MTTLPLLDCCEMLTIDPKTLRHWLRQAGIPLQPHPTDARVKCLTMEQVQALAALHGRALKPHPALPSGSGASTSACGEPQPLTSPASPSEADLHQKLASLEAQVTLLHHQLAHLTSVLLGQQTSVDPPRAWLAALVPPTGPLWPCSAELAQKEGISQVVAGPLSPSSGEPTASLASSDRIWSSWHLCRDLPAGRRTSPEPRFPRVVCLAGFRVVLPICGQVWALHRLPRLRQRADALLASPSRHPSAPLQTASGRDGALDDRLSGAGSCQTAILRRLTLIS